MDLTLVQTAEGDAIGYLRALQARLPETLTARAEILDVAPEVAQDRLPRLIVCVPEATDEEVAQVQSEMAALAQPGFEMSQGSVLRPIAEMRGDSPQGAPPVPKEFRWVPEADLALADPSPDALKAIEEILNAEPSGLAFPELSYAGEARTAYDAMIVHLKGIVPMEDKGERLFPNALDQAPIPDGPPEITAIWTEVRDHLQREIQCFRDARNWLGDGGHLRNLYRDQVVFDHNFMDLVNDTYKLVPAESKVTIYLDTAMEAIQSLGGSMGGFGKGLAKAVGVFWDQAKKSAGDPDGKISGKIHEIRVGVDTKFTETVRCVEAAHAALVKDWGNLDRFGRLLDDKVLVWEEDSVGLRNAHAFGFHYEALRVLLSLKSQIETKQTSHLQNTWGRVRIGRKSKTARSRKWDQAKMRVTTATSKSCGKYYYDEILLGHEKCNIGDSRGARCNTPVETSQALLKKLFKTDLTIPDDPQLAISDKLFDDKDWRKAHGWTLAPDY